jgi:hypothetical protein
MDTCPRASGAHISKERKNGQKSGVSRAHLSNNAWKAQILKILERVI